MMPIATYAVNISSQALHLTEDDTKSEPAIYLLGAFTAGLASHARTNALVLNISPPSSRGL
jgi:hypothetical protein